MTREEMVKISWKPYMSIEYQCHGMVMPAECLLTAIDFDAEVLTLIPLHAGYEKNEFYANLKYCSLSKRIKAAAIDGKVVPDRKANELRAKKIGVYIDDPESDDFNNAS